MSGIVESAKKIIEANGLSDKIEIIRGKVEEISLPEGIDKVFYFYFFFYIGKVPSKFPQMYSSTLHLVSHAL